MNGSQIIYVKFKGGVVNFLSKLISVHNVLTGPKPRCHAGKIRGRKIRVRVIYAARKKTLTPFIP